LPGGPPVERGRLGRLPLALEDDRRNRNPVLDRDSPIGVPWFRDLDRPPVRPADRRTRNPQKTFGRCAETGPEM